MASPLQSGRVMLQVSGSPSLVKGAREEADAIRRGMTLGPDDFGNQKRDTNGTRPGLRRVNTQANATLGGGKEHR